MKIEIKKTSLDALNADALVIFVSKKTSAKAPTKTKKNGGERATDRDAVAKNGVEGKNAPKVLVQGVTKAIQAKVEAATDQGVLTGTANEVVFFREANLSGARHLLVVGLGDVRDLEHEALRQAAASAVTVLKQSKCTSVAIALDSLPHNSLAADVTTQALAEGLTLSDYAFNEFKETKGEAAAGLERVVLVSASKTKPYEAGLDVGVTLAECVNFARWLGDRPGNRMTPTILAEEAVKAAKGTKLKVNVWDRARIKSERMGSFLSVSLGSSQEPRFIIMEYNGAGATKRPICFVGKGLTFDSGGISIKPSAGMEEMKYDMCGGAAVIAAMLAIARLRLKVNAIAFVPSSENMPGPGANKPGDIVTARNGKSIEVNNTDAEGRLILADALVYACEQKPAMILDAATLTGAMVVALGNLHTGFFTRNDKLAEKVQRAADASGEWVWRMPLTDFHAKDMRGTFADLSNISSSKGAGSSTAAGFLEQFVDRDIPWAHFDVAGTAWHVGDRLPYCPRKGASGSIVRTFVQMAMGLE